MAEPQHRYTLDDYYAVEESSPLKHEYYRGEIFAMAGASLAHNDIASNVHALLRTALRGSGCRAFTGDLRMACPNGLYTYPDVSVICGKVELIPDRPDTATNPVLLVEVLSDATRDYDRGKKFVLYRSIPSLREYVTIEQRAIDVEHHFRRRDGSWNVRRAGRLKASVRLRSVGVALPLAEIYREVF